MQIIIYKFHNKSFVNKFLLSRMFIYPFNVKNIIKDYK